MNKDPITETFDMMINDTKLYSNNLERLKELILDDDDYQIVKDKRGNTVGIFIKKSGYYKLKRAFNITLEIKDYEILKNDNNRITSAWFLVEGKLPNGEVTEAIGGCERSEKNGKTTNDIVATAHTRANLRAISQLIDFGKVSADEISSIEEIKPKKVNKPKDKPKKSLKEMIK